MAAWITAFAALLAALVAALGLLVVWKMQRTLLRRLHVVEDWYLAYRHERWRAQADLVSAWPVSERETFEKIITRGVVGAAVRNGSASPVYEVELVYRDPEAAWTAVKRVPMVPPADTAEVFAGFGRGPDRRRTAPRPDQRRRHDPPRHLGPDAPRAALHRPAGTALGAGRARRDDYRFVIVSAAAMAAPRAPAMSRSGTRANSATAACSARRSVC
jgi:hypothetical protein